MQFAVGHRSKHAGIDVRNIIAKQIAAIDVMEDKKKEISLPGYKY